MNEQKMRFEAAKAAMQEACSSLLGKWWVGKEVLDVHLNISLGVNTYRNGEWKSFREVSPEDFDMCIDQLRKDGVEIALPLAELAAKEVE